MPKRTRPGSKLFKSIISKLLYMDSFQEHPICKQEYVNIYWLYLGIECPYFGGLVDLLAFFLWRSLICCDVRPEKKWENIVHRHYSQAPSKRPLGSFFCTTEIIKYQSKKKWGQTGLRDLTHYNVARQNEHCNGVHSAV